SARLSFRNSVSRRVPWSAHHSGEIHLSIRSSHRADDRDQHSDLEAHAIRSQGLCDNSLSSAACLYLFLREVHGMEWRFCLGRSLRVYCRGTGCVHLGAAAITILRFVGEAGTEVGLGIGRDSFVIQLASLAFWLPLEIYQMEMMGHPTFVIGLRFKNIVGL